MFDTKITSAAEVFIVNFNNFVCEIPRMDIKIEQGLAMYVQRSSPNPGFYIKHEHPDIEEIYFQKRQAKLYRFSLNRMLEQLYCILPIEEKPVTNLLSELEYLSIEQLEKYGCPNRAVLLESRTWILTNPKDFVILVDKKKPSMQCLVCLHPYRNKVIRYIK